MTNKVPGWLSPTKKISTWAEMKAECRWLLHKNKRPYYIDGSPRSGELDSPEDSSHLAIYDQAKATLSANPTKFSGLGFALGNGWQGIDLDKIDTENTGLAPLVDDLPGYVEWSPSRNGVHAIGKGEPLESFKRNGIEVYSGKRFFTVTENVIRDGELTDISTFVQQSLVPLANREMTPTVSASNDSNAETNEGEWGLALAALNHINASCSYDDWIKVGMALHSTGNIEAFDAWNQWSATSPAKYKGDKDLRGHWRSFQMRKPKGATLGSLFHIASQHGWERPSPDATSLFGAVESRRTSVKPLLVRLNLQAACSVDHLIQNYLDGDGVGMVWGAPGSYKSFVALDWALCVATGSLWAGRKCRKGLVWYLAGEGHGGLVKRVQAWRKAREIYSEPDILVSTKAITLDAEHGQSEELAALLESVETGTAPSLLVVDTLARSMVGDESNTKDASRFVAAIDRLVAAIRGHGGKCVLMLVHHARKDGEIYRGSSVLRGAIDFEFEITKTSNLHCSIRAHKVKDDSLPPEINLRGMSVSLGVINDGFGDPAEISSLVFSPSTTSENPNTLVEEAMGMSELICRVLRRDFPNGASKRTLMNAVRREGSRFRTEDFGSVIEVLKDRDILNVERGKAGWHIWPSTDSQLGVTVNSARVFDVSENSEKTSDS